MTSPSFDIEHSLQRHSAALRRLALVLLRDDADAEDAVQEVWLGALQRPPADDRSLGGWLSASLHNVARKLRRGDARRVRRQAVVARETVTEDHGVVLAREDQAHRLVAAVSALEPPYRDAIWQRYFEGMAPRDIARASGEPIATVQSRLQRGLQKLRTRLGGAGESDWRGALAVAFGLKGNAAPAGAAAMVWQGVILMTTLTKLVAGLAVVVALVWLIRDLSVAPPDASEAAAQGAEVAAAQSPEGAEHVADTRLQRIPVPPNSEQAPLTFIEVHVRNDETGEAVAGASVLFVKPGFAYANIPHEQRDRYSRSSESYLRDFGVCQITDENGITRVPIEAASRVVVARKGNLYGTNATRGGVKILEVLVSGHHTFVVETADALGNPVPHVKVVGQFNPMSQWTLGTTDDNGILTHVLKPPSGDAPKQIWLHAELLDDAHGREAIDLRAPPTFVRLTLPATGMVRAKITNLSGVALDRQILESLHAELSIVGAAPRPTLFGRPGLVYIRPDAEGNACFENIVLGLGKTLQLRFPGMVLDPKVFHGPSENERVVSIVQTIKPGHPFVVGTLVDPDNKPVVGKQFSIFCRQEGDLLASVGGKTDEQGRFLAYLSERCTDKSAVVFTLGMDMTGVGFAREARVPVVGALHGRIDLGEVVMPDEN